MNRYTSKRLTAVLYQVKRAIRVHGETYSFTQAMYNEFGEPEDSEDILSINGIWHTSNSFIQQTISEATKINSKQQPQLLCSYEDATKLEKNATLSCDSGKYKVIDIINVGGFCVIADICLEEVK